MKKKEEKIILEGVFQRFSPMTYPGRIYGMYVWDWEKDKFVIDEEFCLKHNIYIKKWKK